METAQHGESVNNKTIGFSSNLKFHFRVMGSQMFGF